MSLIELRKKLGEDIAGYRKFKDRDPFPPADIGAYRDEHSIKSVEHAVKGAMAAGVGLGAYFFNPVVGAIFQGEALLQWKKSREHDELSRS